MKQYGEVMLACDAFHQIHHKLVVVVGKVGILKDRRQLKLVGSYFVTRWMLWPNCPVGSSCSASCLAL